MRAPTRYRSTNQSVKMTKIDRRRQNYFTKQKSTLLAAKEDLLLLNDRFMEFY